MKSPPALNHGFSSVTNRQPKAEKIRIILDEYLSLLNKRKLSLLDIGTGSGDIANHLNEYFDVFSVDIKDQRAKKKAYNFLVANEFLPFKSNTFDIVISNHVLEHVQSPQHHIDEIFRVLKPQGWFYLATPNRLWPWEVHYKVPIAHYFPNKLFHWLMKKTGKYQEDINLQTSWQIKSLCKTFSRIDSISETICQYPRHYRLHIPSWLEYLLGHIPKAIYKCAHIFLPTFIFMLQKNAPTQT